MNKQLVDGKYSFTDLVNIPQLEKLFTQFSNVTGLALGLVSHPDQKLIISTGWQDICTKFHRAFPKSELHCIKSNHNLTTNLKKQKAINIDHCQLGMVDGATPIIIKGVHIANIFTGQVLFNEPDIDYFQTQGKENGYDAENYIEALNKVPVVTEEKFKESLSFISEMALMIAEQGLTKLENKKAEDELKIALSKTKDSESKLKEAQTIAHLGNWQLDLINNTLYWSDEVYNIFGLSPHEFEPTYGKFIEIIHSDDRQLVNNAYVNSLISKKPYEIEHRLILKNGDLRYIREKCRSEFDNDGKPTLSVGVIQDITDEINTRHAIDEIEVRFKETVNLLPQIVFEINLNGDILFVNKYALDTFGYSPEEIENDFSFKDTLIPSDREIASKNMQSVLMGKKKGNFEYTALRKDGSTFPCIIYSSTLYKNGKPAGLRGVTIDISDLKQLEDNIKKSEEWFRAISEQSTEGITIADTNGNYVFSNPAFSKMTGYSSQKLLNMKVFDLLKDPKGVIIDKKLFGIPTEVVLTRKDGTLFPIEIIVNSLKIGSENLFMGTIKDITERKQAEKESLAHKKEIEDSEKKFRELFEKSGDAILILKNGIFIDCNQATVKLLGYSDKNKVLNLHPSELSPTKQPDGRKSKEKANSMMSIALKKGSHRFEWNHIKSNGEIFPAEVLLTAISSKPNNEIIHVVWRDITKRKIAENTIITAKEYLEQLTNSMWDAVFSVKMPERVIEWANDSYNILGYETDEYIGNNTSFLYADKADFFAFGEKIKEALTNRKNVLFSNHELKRKNGETFPADITLTFHRENTVVTKVTTIIRDVSERVKMENELIKVKEKAEEGERKFKAIINQSTEGITVADMDGNYLIVNPTFCNMSGYSEKELLKMNVFDMKAKNQSHKSFYDSKEKSEGLPIIVNLQKKDGTEYLTEIVGSIIHLDNQKLVLGTIRDITERKIAEDKLNKLNKELASQNEEYQVLNEELAHSMNKVQTINNELEIAKEHAEESESRLSTFVNSIPDIVCYKDGKGRWLMANNADLELFNLVNVDYYNKTDAELAEHTNEIYKDAFLGCMVSDEETWKNKSMTQGIEIIPTIDGKEKVFEVYKIPIFHPNGDRKGLGVIGRDITELQNTQDKLLIAKEHAEESDRLKSAFLANMSHEIRTPMNGILGFADLLKTPDITGDELTKYTGIIENSGKRMLNIINDLIDISKIEAGQMEIKISECDINKQIEYLHIFFKPEAEKKGLNLSINNDKYTNELIIDTDREKLYAILTNLIKNSIKYTHNGNIEIGYKVINEDDTNYLEFYVEDTGIGIPINRQTAIFERFVQADIEDEEVYEGAGLGLAITKAYVEMLGGKIWVESTEDIGSKFYFTIPNKSKIFDEVNPIDESNQISNNIMEANKLNILIAEDEEFADTYLTIILKKISKEIHHTKNGADAVEIFRNNPDIDLILMDIRMPIMSGYTATEEIRKLSSTVKIIAQTAYALEGDREKAINAGCDGYISKPINKDELISIIERLF